MPFLNSDLFQAPLPETDSQSIAPSSGPFSEVSSASCPDWRAMSEQGVSGSSCPAVPSVPEQLKGGPPYP